MAKIKIYGDQNKGCIFFDGSTVEPKFLGTIIAVVKADETDRIVISRTDRFRRDGVTFRTLFRRLKATRVQNQTGENLIDDLGMTVAEVATYINEQASNYFAGGAVRPGLDEHPNFVLDATNTTIMVDNGENFGVNTLKAILGPDGLVDIVSADHSGNALTHYEDCPHENLQVNGSFISGGPNDVVNALNELFTVGAFESVVVSDPYATMVADVGGVLANGSAVGDNAIDPVGDDILASSAAHYNKCGWLSSDTINQAGEYYTFDIRVTDSMGFGLVQVDGDVEFGADSYGDPNRFCDGVANSANWGYLQSHWFHSGNKGPWTYYGQNTSSSIRSGWYNFGTSEERVNYIADAPIKMKVGLDANGYIEVSYWDVSESSWQQIQRSSFVVQAGREFKLGVKIYGTRGRLHTQPKIHELAVDDTPVVIGDSSITVFGTDVSGDLATGITYLGTDDNDNDGFVTAETLTQAGEYFQFTWTDGDANLGLFSENDHAVGDLDADRTVWSNDDYLFFGARSEHNGTMNGLYNENAYATTVLQGAVGAYYGRVGFDTDGRATVWASTDGVTYTVKQRIDAAAPTGTYRFIWIPQDSNANISTLTKGQLATGPTMYFRYVESPDGNFQYPLFATAEEAEYYYTQSGGTDSVKYDDYVFPDDPTATVWKMPIAYRETNGGFAPENQTFLGNPVTYTEITTLTNADLAPGSFSYSDYTFAEDASVALQVSPQDATYTTTVSGLPDGLTFTGGYLVSGTTRHVDVPRNGHSYELLRLYRRYVQPDDHGRRVSERYQRDDHPR